MTSLANHQSDEYTKLILLGHPKAGKTGSLTSLVPDFNLRILDLDNGLDPLKTFVRKEHPERLAEIEFRTIADEYKATALGPVIAGKPRAFVEATKMLNHWKYDDIDLGVPAEWGPDCILVIDSLTFLSNAAYNWAEDLSKNPDPRGVYGTAQKAIEKILALIQSDAFRTNVIVISHIRYVETEDGKKGFPNAVGEALSPIIPRYFTSVALCERTTTGGRTIQTAPTRTIDLANPKPFEMLPKYPISTGLGDFFKVLRAKPKLVEMKDAKRRV